MKLRKIFIGACTLAIMGLNLDVTAQNNLQAKPEKGTKMETTKTERGGTPEENANSMTMRLQKILKLTPDQAKKIYQINLRAASALNSLKSSSKKGNQEKVASINKKRNEEIKNELDDTQLMKFERISNQREGSVRGSGRSAEKKLAQLNELLNLTTEQEKLILNSLKKYEFMMDEVVKNANSESKQTAVALQKLRQEQKQEIMLHLTKEQLTTLEEAEKEGHRGNARSGRSMKDQKGKKSYKGHGHKKGHNHNHEGHNHEGHDHEGQDKQYHKAERTEYKAQDKSYKQDMKEDAKTTDVTKVDSPRVVRSQSNNKKVISTGATSGTGTGTNVGAPSTETGEVVNNTRPAGPNESRAEALTNQMKKGLGLSDKQAASILGINLDTFNSIAKLGSKNSKERSLALEKIHNKRTAAIADLLTRDQLGQFMATNAQVIEQMNLPMRGTSTTKAKRKRKMQNSKGRN